jgi:hypothetical protein
MRGADNTFRRLNHASELPDYRLPAASICIRENEAAASAV